jgi:hypothetical protein
LQWQWLGLLLRGAAQAAQEKQRRSQVRCDIVNMSRRKDRKDLNVTRRLTRMLKAAGLPRVGGAHVLRMSYVNVTHSLHALQGECTYQNVVRAMRELLEGWSLAEEEHSLPGGYQHRLLNVIDDIHGEIVRFAGGQWD